MAIKIRRITKTTVINETTGQMIERKTDTDIMAAVPSWVVNVFSLAGKIKRNIENEIKVWKSGASLKDKYLYGYHLVGVA